MTPADGSRAVLASQAIAERAADILLHRGPSLVDLQRDLDGEINAHWSDTAERLDLIVPEFDEDMAALSELATAIAAASVALAKLTSNNISVDGPRQSASALADLIAEPVNDLLLPSAERALESMVAVKLAGGAI